MKNGTEEKGEIVGVGKNTLRKKAEGRDIRGYNEDREDEIKTDVDRLKRKKGRTR